MPEKKVDRRVRYTKMVIKKSFISILKEKPIAKVTIKEICEEADINRATFYAHYTDQYDLMHRIEDEFLEDINLHFKPIARGMTKTESLEVLEGILEYLKENIEVCSLLLSDKGNIDFQKRVMMIAQTQCAFDFSENKKLSQEDSEYIFIFVTVGSVGIIQKWMSDGMKKPAAELAKIIINITENGLLLL